MGSVKDLDILDEPTSQSLGRARFRFSDRYSVFDWGEMPDLIEGKGKALAMMGGYNFELLEESGVGTHYRGMLTDGDVVKTSDLDSPSEVMEITLAEKPVVTFENGEYSYSSMEGNRNYLIPLEIVFRNSIPVGSSLRKRYEPGELGFDFKDWPEEEIDLARPIVEYSTKLEEKDRYLQDQEARKISGLSQEEFNQLGEIARKVNEIITERAQDRGFEHLDGKIECVYVEGSIKVADVVGTFDENRFSFKGFQISKEVLRQWYIRNDPQWYQEVTDAQKQARERGVEKWKTLVDAIPKSLDDKLQGLISDMYRAGANKWLDREVFDVRSLDRIVEDLRQWMK